MGFNLVANDKHKTFRAAELEVGKVYVLTDALGYSIDNKRELYMCVEDCDTDERYVAYLDNGYMTNINASGTGNRRFRELTKDEKVEFNQ